MRKSSTYKILAAVMALSAVNVFVPHNMLAYNITSDNTTISPEEPIKENIYGNGYSFTITGGTIDGDVFGAGNDDENYSEDASGGNVTINGNAEVKYAVYGGYSESGQAHHNIVNISGDNSRVTRVYGGYSEIGSAYHNTVNISGGSVANVHGGSSYSGTAHHNTVNISDGAVSGDVCGGYSEIGSAYHNTVNISGGIRNITY